MPSTGAETAPNFAEITVLEDRVRLTLEIDFANYRAFAPAPTAALATEPDPGSPLPATGTTFSVRAGSGEPITPVVRTVGVRDRKPRPTAMRPAGNVVPTPVQPISAQVVYAELDYPFSERPAKLTFVPPSGEDGLGVTLGFLARHGRVPVTDYRYLSQPETLSLDWDDPWYSAFENPNLTRHHKSPLMSFISIEPREVRHEIIFRLRDLERWAALDLRGAETLDAAVMARISEAARAFFRTRNPIVIDGEARNPAGARVVLLDVGVSGLQVVEAVEGIDRATALLGVVLSYPEANLPQELAMTWELFPDGVETIPVMVIDPAGGVPSQVRPGDSEVTWTNFLTDWQDPSVAPVKVETSRTVRIPVLSVLFLGLGCASVIRAFRGQPRLRGAGLGLLAVVAAVVAVPVVLPITLPVREPDAGAAAEIAEGMLRNAATAMLEVQPQRFDAALTSFVAEPEVAMVGVEMRRGLAVSLPSGARARTDAIGDLTVEEITSGSEGLSFLTRWTAQASGGHWGHLHRRTVDYRALMDVVERDGAWRLQGLTVLSARVGG